MKHLILLSLMTSISCASIKIYGFNLDLTNHKMTEENIKRISFNDKCLSIAAHILTERYRFHIYNKIKQDENCIVNPKNARYIQTIYSVILTELIKATLKIQNGLNDYGNDPYTIIECKYNNKPEYTQPNWNYFFYINLINMCMNSKETITNCIEKTYCMLVGKNQKYITNIDKSKNDIEYYFNKLGLSEYITSLRNVKTVMFDSTANTEPLIKYHEKRIEEIYLGHDKQCITMEISNMFHEYQARYNDETVFDETKSAEFEDMLLNNGKKYKDFYRNEFREKFINKKIKMIKYSLACMPVFQNEQKEYIKDCQDRLRVYSTVILRIRDKQYGEKLNKGKINLDVNDLYAIQYDQDKFVTHVIVIGACPLEFLKIIKTNQDEGELFDKISSWDEQKLNRKSHMYNIYKLITEDNELKIWSRHITKSGATQFNERLKQLYKELCKQRGQIIPAEVDIKEINRYLDKVAKEEKLVKIV